ncbi:SAM-dependent methyltransferase [Streptomonospora salina]|uniref:Trans-aconitate methyltransferase n=1 Tax=Streptomonospora salina TaxID=104205 RepID=A0A841E501_9ACTN|nr:SAM-dependent methyltransferase [Streptomonospora salina]MBB5998096.1 trans-aconitate methyltransferase [Streptomonospora salina]
MPDHTPAPPAGVDPYTPSAARLYDFYLGGKDNYAADREAGTELLERIPELHSTAHANRYFLRRVVRHLAAEAGIDQFLDIGSGLPTQDNVHQVAQRHAPGARVVYVDNDPIVLAHAHALLAEDPATTAVAEADLRDPAGILAHPQIRGMIDFSRPVAVLMIAVLHFLTDEDRPYEVVAALRDRLCPGSYIAVSHLENETSPQRAAFMEQVYARSSATLKGRSHAEIRRFFTGMELVEPGVMPISQWRRDPTEPYWPPEQAWGDGGLGRLTQRPPAG